MSFGHFGIDPRKPTYDIHCARQISIRIPHVTGSFQNKVSNNRKFNSYAQANSFSSTAPQKSSYINRNLFNKANDNVIFQFELIENMLQNFNRSPFHNVVEQTLIQMMHATNVIVWLNNRLHNMLSSPTRNISVNYNAGIVGLCFRTKQICATHTPGDHPSFNLAVDDADTSAIYIPLLVSNFKGETEIIGVAQIMRSNDWLPFEDSDEPTAEYFCQKFYHLSHLFYRDHDIQNILASVPYVSQITEIEQLLSKMFKCDSVEFWMMENCNGKTSKYQHGKGFQEENNRFITTLIKNGPIEQNLVDISKYKDFHLEPSSLLLSAIQKQINTFVVILKRKKNSFSQIESTFLSSLVPIFSPLFFRNCSLETCQNLEIDRSDDSKDLSLRLKALLEVAEILSGVLDIDVLIPTIMSRACSLLNTERCSLFLVDHEKQEMVSRFHGGLDKSIRLPMNRGIIGHTATTGEIVNITNAYEDPRFDKAVDKATGFITRTILTVPIYNNRGEIAGITEMINRLDGSAFDESDIKMLMAFNVFCGISLDNAKLYQSSLNLTRQLRGFVELTSALNKTKTVRDILEEILSNAKEVIHANRATIFLVNSDEELTSIVNIGNPIIHGTHFAEISAQKKEELIFSREDVTKELYLMNVSKQNSILQNELDDDNNGRNDSEDGDVKILSRVSSVLTHDSSLFESSRDKNELTKDDDFSPICDFPLISNEGKLVGVMELSCSWKILSEDIKLLDFFAVFATVSIEKSELEEIAKFGRIEQDLRKWLSPEERKSYEAVPVKLRIDPNDPVGCTAFTINFDAPAWEGIGHFKVVFAQFSSFGLLKEFKIQNETFYRFLNEISQTYKKVPYHNWRHAVDVTEFISYELRISKMDTKLSKFELLGLLTAAVCHDANHDGFTNVFNEKAETPLGILFKNQSVMETHHCSESISVLSKAENNIFKIFTPLEFKQMWTLIIDLILVTDMSKHFGFLKASNEEMDKGPLNMENEYHRSIVMKAILKCGDISNVSRPFELADRWCDVLCEEFFRQGDLEMTNGMEYTSPLNDREHLDKPKSQIGFYTFVCLPLYECCARAMPELIVNVNQVKSNLDTWKKASAEKAAAEAANN
ncbi:3'5'-cyclic nucleotide phosphodiesterase family protein [Tritrichomonas foetus]|uniref:3'5'-cyclic nucleotide phosphodiesterase family protein n=1 Tax=Tritrichomonas foetus TaxID=1144522 RepID=A0A1J4J8X1_9EUKA|nr:3'5'-cyclic nucleotide phosphodiesterase family protein [Tritrichomonas foetus]|eukprot:OHS95630.1 3'5'-cyclic nucleotide phosphodiesterase family protein [Tritrichomonas foetus]